jgi:hypothetical protein
LFRYVCKLIISVSAVFGGLDCQQTGAAFLSGQGKHCNKTGSYYLAAHGENSFNGGLTANI